MRPEHWASAPEVTEQFRLRGYVISPASAPIYIPTVNLTCWLRVIAHKYLYDTYKRVYTLWTYLFFMRSTTKRPFLSLVLRICQYSGACWQLRVKTIFFYWKKILSKGKSFYRYFFIFLKTLVYNGKLSRNRMALEFFHFGFFPARNKLVVSQ